MVIDSVAVFETVGVSESVTCTVKLAVPVPVGVPLITPVDGLRVRPAGRLPAIIDQEYGALPPVAVMGEL
jgi:hypothetical protein